MTQALVITWCVVGIELAAIVGVLLAGLLVALLRSKR